LESGRTRALPGAAPGERTNDIGDAAEAPVGETTLEQLDDDVRRISRGYLSNPPLR
jgi:hypothetical protein